jgi:hypothetical protein
MLVAEVRRKLNILLLWLDKAKGHVATTEFSLNLAVL